MNARILILYVALFLAAIDASPQIVNIEAKRIVTDTTGWFGDLSGNFSFQQNVNTIYALTGEVHVENKSRNNKNLWLFLGNSGFLKVDSSSFANNTLALALYNRKLSKVIRAEGVTAVFNNQITNIRFRWIGGGGPRFKIADLTALKMYGAVWYLFEHEESSLQETPSKNESRMSPYFTLTIVPLSNLKVVSTTYYQPRLDDFTDYRILHVDQLKIDVSKKFAFTVDFSYLYDAFPQPDVPDKNLALSMGVKYKLK
jgi:hypothetical protein